MNDDSYVRGNPLWRATFGEKRKVKYWWGPLIMLIFFGFLAVAGTISILGGEYDPRLVDWGWYALYTSGAILSAVDLWWQWRKRRKRDQEESDSLNNSQLDPA
ncbi:MAG: hypothetical protein ACXADL_13540 [Candidatus Thorarchaeota archaeon]